MGLVSRHKGFVFASVGVHPEYVKEIPDKEVDEFLDRIKENKDSVSSVGETGLDFHWVKEPEWQQKQRELFVKMIGFAKEIDRPLTIHSREAYEEVVKVLEQEDAKRVHLHLFGDNKLVGRIAENGWHVSIGPIVLRSKKHSQIARDMPLGQLMLETDAPWNHPSVFLEGKRARNEPTSVRAVAEKIAEIRKATFDEIWKACGQNAAKFFGLGL
jgi:TatD DNase family protein